MIFEILTGNGLSGNILKSGDRQATIRQTPQQHEELLDIRTIPGYEETMLLPPGPEKSLALNALKARAELREMEDPRYWSDEYPRRPITQSSSWIGNISYDPYSQYAQVQMGNRNYGYSMSPIRLAQILNSQSIGKEFN